MNFKKRPLLFIVGIFYSCLCVFSIVVGLMYIAELLEMKDVEIPESFMNVLSDKNAVGIFSIIMGFVTFTVGLTQGLSAYCCFLGKKPVNYFLVLGFTILYIISAAGKIFSSVSFFPIMKVVFYVAILIILLLKKTRETYFTK